VNTVAGFELRGVGFDGPAGPLFEGIDLTIRPGTLVVVSGPSGSGKSVLAAISAGVLRPTRGEACLNGTEVDDAGGATVHIGYAPQEDALVGTLTAAETVGLPLQELGMEKAWVRERTAQWLDVFGLSALTDRLVVELSGGQRQRIVIARAFAVEANAFVLDEPAAGLDADNRMRVCEVVFESRTRGASIFCVSHAEELLERADERYTLAPDGEPGSRLLPS
jgi:ABC-type multidrug transport system ATPase subunit